MATSLLEYERIETTLSKAKELRRVVEKLITKAKVVTPKVLGAAKGDEYAALASKRLHNIRRASKTVRNRKVLQRLFDTYSLRYMDRQGGYTRIYKLGPRPGDATEMAIIELVDRNSEELAAAKESAPKKKDKTQRAATKKSPAKKEAKD